MGSFVSRMFRSYFEKMNARILMVGLDGSGKTTVLYQIKFGEPVSSIPTIGFNFENIEFDKLKMSIWDVGGQTKLRPMWKHYYTGCQGLIFLIDSSDKNRIQLAKDELDKILSNEQMEKIPVLIFANKQDLNIMSVKEVINDMDLSSIRGNPWHCQGCSALTGNGLVEGFKWLQQKILNDQ